MPPAARFITGANKAAETASRWAAALAGVGLFLMMLTGAADILAGKLLGRPLPGAFEAAEALLAACALLPLAYNRATRAQIRVGFAAARLPKRAQSFLAIFGDLAGALLFGVLGWQGWKYAVSSIAVLEYQSGPVAFPVYPAKISLAAALTLMALICLARAFAPLAKGRERN